MLKAIIIEDELYIRKGLISMLNKTAKNVSILSECATIEEAVKQVKEHKPNLVFLDIELSDGNAFDFIKRTSDIDYKIIFITAYKEYAFEALKNEAIDYLLKPIDENELTNAIQKVERQFKGEVPVKDHLVLSLHDSYQFIDFKSLLYCKSDKGYTTFYLQNGREFIASKPLKEFEQSLANSHFFRPHQSYIVNMNHVDNYHKSGYLYLKSGVKIPVSKSKKEALIYKFFR